jgi:hypothetical protein
MYRPLWPVAKHLEMFGSGDILTLWFEILERMAWMEQIPLWDFEECISMAERWLKQSSVRSTATWRSGHQEVRFSTKILQWTIL